MDAVIEIAWMRMSPPLPTRDNHFCSVTCSNWCGSKFGGCIQSWAETTPYDWKPTDKCPGPGRYRLVRVEDE